MLIIFNSNSNFTIPGVFFVLLVLAILAGCDQGSEDEEQGENGAKFTLVQEEGDASDDEDEAQDISSDPPFVIMGEIRTNADKDYYKFNGKSDKTYLIGVTGNRTMTVGGQQATDGLIVYQPPADGPVVICVSGGNIGAYIVTVTEA